MERFIINELIKWNSKKKRKPLVIYGARQIGKTYLIKNLFAKKYYSNNYIYIDFKKDDDVREFVCGDGKNTNGTSDAKKIIEFLSLRENKNIDKSTLLIFDEVQEALPILTALKYFKQEFEDIPVIASGSMVRIKIKREQHIANQHKKDGHFFPVGAILELNMYPVTFDEFLFNYNEQLYNKISSAYKNKVALEPSTHQLAMDALYKFLLIGGMPENVQMFLDGHSLVDIRENLISLFNNYLNDMELYQARTESIVRAKQIFKSIYSQLNKESKNFKASLIQKDLKNRDLITPLDWLCTASVVYKSLQVKEKVTIPLVSNEESNYRLYLMDTGFLSYQSDINMATFIDKNSQNELSGIFFENYVACELVAKNFPLFYWKGKTSAEFEFVISFNNKIIPIDVKKGKGTLNSLSKYKAHNSCQRVIKVSSNNFGIDEAQGIMTIPLYMFFMFLNEIKEMQQI